MATRRAPPAASRRWALPPCRCCRLAMESRPSTPRSPRPASPHVSLQALRQDSGKTAAAHAQPASCVRQGCTAGRQLCADALFLLPPFCPGSGARLQRGLRCRQQVLRALPPPGRHANLLPGQHNQSTGPALHGRPQREDRPSGAGCGAMRARLRCRLPYLLAIALLQVTVSGCTPPNSRARRARPSQLGAARTRRTERRRTPPAASGRWAPPRSRCCCPPATRCRPSARRCPGPASRHVSSRGCVRPTLGCGGLRCSMETGRVGLGWVDSVQRASE